MARSQSSPLPSAVGEQNSKSRAGQCPSSLVMTSSASSVARCRQRNEESEWRLLRIFSFSAERQRNLPLTLHPSFSGFNILIITRLSLWRVEPTLHNPSFALHIWRGWSIVGIKLCFRTAKAMLYVGFSYMCALCQLATGALSSPWQSGRRRYGLS